MKEKIQTSDDRKACGLHCIKIKDFKVSMGEQVIIEDINMHIHCGQLTAVIGRNGAGKSTLIKAILDEIPHEGTIEFQDMRNNKIQDIRLGYVPQHLNIAKNTPTSVYDLLASYISDCPIFLFRSKSVYNKIKEQLSKFQGEDLIDKRVCDLSGGEMQRVLMSMATIPVPNLLILDEPASGIDQNGLQLFYNNIEKLKKEYDLAIILVSHDLEYVEQSADHVILLDKTIKKEGSPKEVYTSNEFQNVFGRKGDYHGYHI